MSVLEQKSLNPIDEIREQFNRLFDDNDVAPALKGRFKTQLESWLNKLNIVSREEFDAQTKVLINAQQQLNMLQQKIERLNTEGSKSEGLETGEKNP